MFHALYIQACAELRAQHYDTAIKLLRELLTLDPSHPEASDLLEQAKHGHQLAHTYARGLAAEESGDWAAAIREYDAVLQADHGYQDARERRERCYKQQQITDRQAELRYHYDARNWQAVLDVDTELASLDQASADPDGLATKARERLHQAELGESYEKARASEAAQDWAAAAAAYAKIIKADPAYRDASGRRDHCYQQRVAELQTQVDNYAKDENWPKVRDAIDELARFDPAAAAAYTDLAASAVAASQLELGEAQQAHEEPRVGRAGEWSRPVRHLLQVQHPRYGVFGLGIRDITSVDISPDGSRLATSSDDGTARIWEIPSGRQLLRIKHPWGEYVLDVAFSPDGHRLATTTGKVRVWQLLGGELLVVLKVGNIRSIAFSPDGNRLATASDEGPACVWELPSGRQLAQVHHEGETRREAYRSPRMELTSTGRKTSRSASAAVKGVAFSPDGLRLATASDDNTARVWALPSGQQLVQVDHDGGVTDVAFSPDGLQFATASDDNTARVWALPSGQQLTRIRHEGPVTAIAYSPNSCQLATAADKTASVWELPARSRS